MNSAFGACEICGGDKWTPVHEGPVRDGRFGNLSDGTAVVARCGGCGADRLDEAHCKDEAFYQGADYRQSLGQGVDAASFFKAHDELQLERLGVLWPASLRGQRVADVGCAAGSFLDHISGLADGIVAIEPGRAYHPALAQRGYGVYAFAKDALADHEGQIDWAFTFDVIEHVGDPRGFLADIAKLLAHGGRLLLSTPNRADALMTLAPAYPAFFYRVHHRWYFDARALRACAVRAGLEIERLAYVQRYGQANTKAWIDGGGPTGHGGGDPATDAAWKADLETRGTADRLYAILKRAT